MKNDAQYTGKLLRQLVSKLQNNPYVVKALRDLADEWEKEQQPHNRRFDDPLTPSEANEVARITTNVMAYRRNRKQGRTVNVAIKPADRGPKSRTINVAL